jgi:hypothetical protein
VVEASRRRGVDVRVVRRKREGRKGVYAVYALKYGDESESECESLGTESGEGGSSSQLRR